MSARLTVSYGSMPAKDEHFSSIAERVAHWLIAAFDWVLEGLERRRELDALTRLDERALKDIGLAWSDLERVGRGRD